MFLLFRVIPMRLLDEFCIAHETNALQHHCHCIGVHPLIQVPSLIEEGPRVLGLSDSHLFTISTGAEDLGLQDPMKPMQWGGFGSGHVVQLELQHGLWRSRQGRQGTEATHRSQLEHKLLYFVVFLLVVFFFVWCLLLLPFSTYIFIPFCFLLPSCSYCCVCLDCSYLRRK